MPGTDIEVTVAKLEQITISTAEACRLNTEATTELTKSINHLVHTMEIRDIENNNIFKEVSKSTDEIKSDLITLKKLEPVMLRSKKFQDNVDAMIRGIFSKVGLVILCAITVSVLTFLNIDPAAFKIK